MSSLLTRSARAVTVLATVGCALVGFTGAAAAAPDPLASPVYSSSYSTGITTQPETLVLDGIRHRQVENARPRPGYVRKAYLPAGQRLSSYQRMLLVEAVAGSSVPDAVRAQVDMLQRRKATDPLVNMDLRTNPRTGEAVLDFTMSGRAADGRPIVEWNVYRYRPVSQGGIRGVQLFGLSLRAYGTDRLAFARNLVDTRHQEIAAVSAARVPRLTLSDW